MKGERPYKLTQRSTLTPEPPFGEDRLRTILSKALGKTYELPSDLSNICEILNSRHHLFYLAQEELKLNKLIGKANHHFSELKKILPQIEFDMFERAERLNKIEAKILYTMRGDPFLNVACKNLAEITKVFHHHSAVVPAGLFQLPDNVKDWRWLAEVLPKDFENALQFKLGHSKTGPLARILEAIVPLLTGEHPSASAIGTQLSKRSKAMATA